MRTFGYVEPIVWNSRTGYVVGGHQRLGILRDQGVGEVDVVVVDLPPAKERALNVALNRITGTFDDAKLADVLRELTADDRLLAGFTDLDFEGLIRKLRFDQRTTDPDHIPENVQARTKLGDVWVMGKHRLLCGDSTSEADVCRLMGNERAVLFATDPPYLVAYDGRNHPHKWNEPEPPRKNKDWSGQYGFTWDESAKGWEIYERFYRVAMEHAVATDAAWYCWHASRHQAKLEALWETLGAFVHQQIIWVKDRPILTRSCYMWQHEPALHGWVRGRRPRVNKGATYPSVWEVATVQPGKATDHPTSKPVELFRRPMKVHTLPGEVCFEPFSGSGSQLIAAEELGRRCFAIEISPTFCDVAVTRWERFTGQKARRS